MPASVRKWVYFILDTRTQLIKIGWAYDVPERLNQLQTGSGGKLVLMGVVPGGESVESSYHHAWRGAHVRGEWFTADSRLVRYINTYGRRWDKRFRGPLGREVAISPRR